jgi:hypothetical protein
MLEERVAEATIFHRVLLRHKFAQRALVKIRTILTVFRITLSGSEKYKEVIKKTLRKTS